MTPGNGEPMADQLVAEAQAEPGDRVRVRSGQATYEGVLMQRHAFSEEGVLVLKLDSGYNVGLALSQGDSVEQLEPTGPRERHVPDLPDEVDALPQVALLGTGGTIASFVEYRTGAVYPATSPEELAAAVPEAFEHARLVPEVVFEAFSEDLTPAHWEALAEAVQRRFDDGARGVVVAHGTDTMHFTAAALACLFDELPGPVVLVGAQRSSDRPSSDAATNLTHAVRVAAKAQAGEVLVVMHAGMGDTGWSVHAAGRARKMHTSRRDAFQSINQPPVATATEEGLTWHTEPVPPGQRAVRHGSFARDVGLLHSYPSLTAEQLEAACGSGLVLAGTGLGHLNGELIPTVADLVEAGKPVVVASTCLHGRTNLRVYETGRRLLQAGAVEAGDVLPETAYVKLAWAIGTAQARDEQVLADLLNARWDGELEDAFQDGRDAEIALALFELQRGREMSDRSPFHYPTANGGEA